MEQKLTNFFMKNQTIINIIAFMNRADLKGEEVPAYNECIKELNEEYAYNDKKEPQIEETIE